ncbi:hypothetical protein [Rhodoplanes elegans]|nr:hypothetical protein [Rhodoplanes elegans]
MTPRGRKSAASLEVLPAKIEAVQRPDAPYDLTDEQAAEWWAVVNRMPADWFPRETHGMLTAYCRHVVAARRVAQLIEQAEKADPFDVANYNTLLIMQEREGRALSSLATRMRLSQQATFDKKKSKPIQGKKPWEA